MFVEFEQSGNRCNRDKGISTEEIVAASLSEKDAHNFKVILLEYDMMAMEGITMPRYMDESRWHSLLESKSTEERYFILAYVAF